MVEILQQDWNVLREASETLERFVLSPDLYWSLTRGGGQHGMAQLSLGTIDLSIARLTAVRWPEPQQADLDSLVSSVEAVRSQWKVAWSNKAQREYAARLRLWQDALAETLSSKRGRSSGYAFEARWRAMLDLLEQRSGVQPAPVEKEALAMMDSRLRAVTRPGPFVWEPEVSAGFPVDPYWYLYVTFPEPD